MGEIVSRPTNRPLNLAANSPDCYNHAHQAASPRTSIRQSSAS
nr:MAG TPA: hypothetical protein [Caudoviricetes sp.]